MKTLCLPFVLLFLYSCQQKSKHPQAGLASAEINAMTAQSILNYADSLDAGLNGMNKQTSLVYQIGDAAMYTEAYSTNGKTFLYIQYFNNEGVSSQTGKYYFKNDSLILVRESSLINRGNGSVYEDKRSFLRSNISFKKESRSASSAAALQAKPYTLISASQTTRRTGEFVENVKILEDAISGNNKFDLVFDQIIVVPPESHILLKSKMPNGYSANIVVNDTDVFIDSLINQPALFKDQKLHIKWEIKDKEAVYVPVAARLTSARGLNK